LKFNNKGNFIGPIGSQGNGPGQYKYFTGLAADTVLQRLIISTYESFLCYDFEGKYLQTYPKNKGSINECLYYTQDQLWSFELKPMIPAEPGKFMEQKMLYRYDKNFGLIDTVMLHQYHLNIVYVETTTNSHYLSTLSSGTFIFDPVIASEPVLRDTLYEIEGSTLRPAIKLDFSEVLKVQKDVNYLQNGIDMGTLLETQNKIRNVTIHEMYRTENFVFARYTCDFRQNYYCHNLITNNGYHVAEGFADDLFGTAKPVTIIPLDLRKGEFCFISDGYDVEGMVEGVGENSNPVVFFLKTRE
jgi:hypothetical protein